MNEVPKLVDGIELIHKNNLEMKNKRKTFVASNKEVSLVNFQSDESNNRGNIPFVNKNNMGDVLNPIKLEKKEEQRRNQEEENQSNQKLNLSVFNGFPNPHHLNRLQESLWLYPEVNIEMFSYCDYLSSLFCCQYEKHKVYNQMLNETKQLLDFDIFTHHLIKTYHDEITKITENKRQEMEFKKSTMNAKRSQDAIIGRK